MDRHSFAFTQMVGRRVIDHNGGTVGRVFAVIHRTDAIDVLVRRGRLRIRIHRLPASALSLLDDGRLLMMAAHLRGSRRAVPASAASLIPPREAR